MLSSATIHSSLASFPLFHRHQPLHSSSTLCLCSAINDHDPLAATPDGDGLQPHPRKHNYKPTSLPQTPLSPEDKVRILGLSLVTKRTPQFPGSIFVQSPGDADVASSLPPLNTLFRDRPDHADDVVDEDMLMRAVDIRRNVTTEIFREALMKKGKFGIRYAANLVSSLADFIDYVMIAAAAMKRQPEFSSWSFNLRAKTVIQESEVVPLIRWLKHNSQSYIRIGKLISMTKGNLKSIRLLAEWLNSVGVRGEFLGSVMLRAGDNIFQRSLEELDEIVEYLESKGVRGEWMGYVISRCPGLLCCSMEEMRSRVAFYVDMGMNDHDFGTMVFDCPKALGFLTLEEMTQKVNYLKEFGLNNEQVGKLLAFKPELMCCSIEERWKPLVKYLYYLGISRMGMRKILVVKPMVFCIDLESNIVQKVRFFQDLGIKNDAIGKMLVTFPPLLTYSLLKKIRPVVIFLMTRAGVTQTDIAKVIALAPQLLGCNIANKLEVNMKYFLSLGISIRQLGAMIADFPMLLRYNIDVLRPKYQYLRRTMVRPLLDVIEFPRFFSYSLEGRIIPRHKILVEYRINFKLHHMLASTDDEFKRKVVAAVDRRIRFESSVKAKTISGSLLIMAGEVVPRDSESPDCSIIKTESSCPGTEDSTSPSLTESTIQTPHHF
uniref:Embryo defective 2219 n=1 Tax=Pelargonium dichondrifolium TaxID=73194 RepID=A0A0G4ALE4_9ROSI|nr:embryo defective 2219 [Pelargonium dichondrifolium]